MSAGVAALCALTVASLLLFILEGSSANGAGFLLGALAGPVLLGWFLADDNARRAGRRYSDWRIPVRRLASWVVLSGWAAGALHGYFFALELTR